MAFNGNHEGLFRAAICESGTALSTTSKYLIYPHFYNIPHHRVVLEGFSSSIGLEDGGGQQEYDELIRNAGCEGKPDTLRCLRELDFNSF